ncbi:hypothetical protein NYE37_13945 [Thermoactinomyces sp. FSL K6-2592]|jgi:hypothetical protein|uniref:hypothetical protein n=1 Tax=Thermoactinomyces sp. FSL K6-2592 TaxID=2975347 RepID=UPI0030F92AEC
MKYTIRLSLLIGGLWIMARNEGFFQTLMEFCLSISVNVIMILLSVLITYFLFCFQNLLMKSFESKKIPSFKEINIKNELVEMKEGIKSMGIEKPHANGVKEYIHQLKSLRYKRIFWWIYARLMVIAIFIAILGFSMSLIFLALLFSIFGGKLMQYLKFVMDGLKSFVAWLFRFGRAT